MKSVLAALTVCIIALSVSGAVSADSVTLNCTARGSFYRSSFGGWESPYVYLNDDEDQYIKFDLTPYIGNPSIAVDSAYVTILNGSHIVGNWNSIWDSAVGIYRATRLDFSSPGTYDSSVRYSQDGMHQTANSVFDVTELVRGWIRNAWSGDVTGGVALSYLNPTGNANLMYSASDLSGATLTINYHKNLFFARQSVASSVLAGCSGAPGLTDGSLGNVLVYADDDGDQRFSISRFTSALREIRLWTVSGDVVGPGTAGRVPYYVTLRSSTSARTSLNASDYETYLGRYYLTAAAFSHTYGELYNTSSDAYAGTTAALLDVNAPAGTRSIFADFGPCNAFYSSSIRISEVEGFSAHTTSGAMLEPLEYLSTPAPANTTVQVQISGLDYSSDIGRNLYAEFKDSAPNLVLLGAERYDRTKYYDFQPALESYGYHCSGDPLLLHSITKPAGSRPYVKMYDGTDVNDHLNDPVYNSYYDLYHYTALEPEVLIDGSLRPTLLNAWQTVASEIRDSGSKGVIFADHHYPIGGPNYQACGYGTQEVAAFRTDLAGTDAGVSMYNADGTTSLWHFWDYFSFYNGFIWRASDVGLSSWSAFTPNTGSWTPGTYQAARQIYLFYSLLRYETLKFDSLMGQLCSQKDLKYFPLYVGESPIHGVDKLAGLRVYSAGTLKWGHEQFTQPSCTYEENPDFTLDIPYTYWGNLYWNNTFSKNELSLVMEMCHDAGEGMPYYSSKYFFAHALDLFLAGRLRTMDLDFFPPSCPRTDDKYILKNANLHSILRAVSFNDLANPFHTLPRQILVIGARGIDRKDYQFTPVVIELIPN